MVLLRFLGPRARQVPPLSPYEVWEKQLPAVDPAGTVAMAYVTPGSDEYNLVR